MSNELAKLARGLRRELTPPQFTTGPIQWGVVDSVTTTHHTVDLYLDGTQRHNTKEYLTQGVRYLQSYAPAVGHVVAVFRGTGGLRSDRLVLGKCATSTTTAVLGVLSWNGRKGNVVPEKGDYTAAQVGAFPATDPLGGVLKGTLPSPEFTPTVASTWNVMQKALGWVADAAGTVGRFVGAHVGPPAQGTFDKGDFCVDPTRGVVWVCVKGGTRGTWVSAGVTTESALAITNGPASGYTLVGTSTHQAAWAPPAPVSPTIDVQGPSTWTQATPASSPSARAYYGFAYDSSSGNAVLFGGYAGSATLNDTWTWNGTTWTQQSPATFPTARYATAMAYDSSSGNAVLFGGFDGSPSTPVLNDTWTWNGTTWTKQNPATVPPRRQAASMAYDSSSGTVLMFGGVNSIYLNDTWTWNGTTWTRESPATSPTARDYASMAYDSSSGNAVLFGGFDGSYFGDTWTWNGTTWTQQSPATSPTARYGAAMAYDSSSGTVVLFGGYNNGTRLNDTWTWNGSTWTQLAPATKPSGRTSSMAYDSSSGTIVLFGGYNGSFLNDTWTFRAGTTNAGPPATGQWAQGDAWLDKNDVLWVCTVGGAPGTWATVAPFHFDTFTESGFTAVGNNSTHVWQIGTFTLPRAMKVRLSVTSSFTLSSTAQELTTIVFVDTAQPTTHPVGGAALTYFFYAGVRIMQVVTTMSASLASGTHKLQLYGSTGGGGGSITPSYVYGEVQGVGG